MSTLSSAHKARVMVPPTVATPRGALFFERLLSIVLHLVRPPVLSEQQREAQERAREAARVRALADQYRRTDPGFASDLHAAAARYEQVFEEAASSLRRAKR